MNRLDAIRIRFRTHPTTYNAIAAPRHLAEVVDIDDIGALLMVAEAAATLLSSLVAVEVPETTEGPAYVMAALNADQVALGIALAPLLEEVER